MPLVDVSDTETHGQVKWAFLCPPQKSQGLVLTMTQTGNVDPLLLVLQVGPDIQIFGQQCDVTSPAGVAYLTAYAESVLGTVDVWINNAGYSGSFQVSIFSCTADMWLRNQASIAMFMHRGLPQALQRSVSTADLHASVLAAAVVQLPDAHSLPFQGLSRHSQA